MTAFGLKKMIYEFEEPVSFDVKCGRGGKPIASTSVEEVARALLEESSSALQTCSALSRNLDMPVSTVRKILRNILQCYPFKITHVQELVRAGSFQNEKVSPCNFSFELKCTMHGHGTFCGRTKPHLQNFVNNQNCRIMGKRESVPNATIAASFSKGYYVVRV
ncbi:hypothetical protein AVEN_224854-1 [Araneus ventricosus]|uniref:DUF4817 domain-containing protein n=1 Tax=Araneus ventricosus TaxID=182803 RepID=A0A4Y1ZUV0_ARAVE|nr:hypothetical protein AVEN_224854-1 [Araneus ventricosus]